MDASMSVLLLRQIASLFLIAAAGFTLVKCGILKTKDSSVISAACIYLACPCVMVTSFQIELTESVRNGFLLVTGAAIAAQTVMVLLGQSLKLAKFDAVSRGSVMYSNAGNLILPLVTSVLGPEWVVYASAFLCVEQVFFWTHCNSMIAGEARPEWRKILTNVNIIAMVVGLALMLLHVRIPYVVSSAMSALGGMLGPLSMLLIGMLLAGADLKAIVRDPRVWLVALLRLIALPVLVLLLLKLSGLTTLHPDGKTLLYITMLAVSAPAATMVTQFSQIHGNRPEYAGAINILTTMLCIVTMPLMTELYMRLM